MVTAKGIGLTRWVLILLLLYSVHGAGAQTSSAKFERSYFYTAFTSQDTNAINQQLDIIKNDGPKGREAFEGALRMKKAGLLKGPFNKLKEFKAGREKLEDMITAQPHNAEFRFLRLMVQEQAPKILGYNNELEEDHKYLIDHFSTMPQAAQKAIVNYSKASKVLSPSDFNLEKE
ncbi:MAG TPA: hypothetical protein VFV68_12455 [Agriterribacter sp.]|nr:hypothetical protein [Agriterribacter sp.]